MKRDRENGINSEDQHAAATPTPEHYPTNPPTSHVPPGPPENQKILKQHLPILYVADRLKEAAPDPPLLAFRRPKNLRDVIGRAEVKQAAPPPTQATTRVRCKLAP